MKFHASIVLLFASACSALMVPAKLQQSLDAVSESVSEFVEYFVDQDASDDIDTDKKQPKKDPKKKPKEPKKGKGGKGKGKVDPACKPLVLDSKLPKGAEPSGAAFDSSRNAIWIISDNGFLLKTDLNGTEFTKYDLGEKLDIEDLVFVPTRPNFLYLAQEAPGSVLEYDINAHKISRRWQLFEDKKDNNRGVESLALLPSPLSRTGYFFIAGSQADAQLHVFEIDLDAASSKALPVSIVRPPGPGEDLSAMATTPGGEVLFLLFDKHRQLLGVNATKSPNFLTDMRGKPAGWFPVPTPVFDIRKAANFHFDLPVFGAEGVAFTPEYMYLGVDASANRGERKGFERWAWPRQVTHCMKHKEHEKLIVQQPVE